MSFQVNTELLYITYTYNKPKQEEILIHYISNQNFKQNQLNKTLPVIVQFKYQPFNIIPIWCFGVLKCKMRYSSHRFLKNYSEANLAFSSTSGGGWTVQYSQFLRPRINGEIYA